MALFGENTVHAWANINQDSGQTIVNSRNMSSIDDVATGRTRFNFSTAVSYVVFRDVRDTPSQEPRK